MTDTVEEKLELDPALEALDFAAVLEAVASHAATTYGKKRVHRLRPGFSAQDLASEFDRIEALTAAVQRGEPLSFAGVHDLGEALVIARTPGTFLDPQTLLHIASLSQAARRLRQTLDRRREEFAALRWYAEALILMPELEKAIGKAIDPNAVQVADHASSELRRIRRELGVMEQRIRSRLEALVKKLGADGSLTETGYTVREERYVLAVRPSSKGKVRGILHGRSQTGGTLFIEPEELVELDNDRRRLEEEEAEEVRRILIEVTDVVRDHLDPLSAAVEVVSILDSLQARAMFAEKVGAMRPRVEEGILRFVQVRHPLLILRKGLEKTVPLDLELGGDSGRVLVITGPNAGGKTVALKTVGLATSLIHSAIWPPAGDGTVVPPIDKWHVVIGDEQSLESDLSSFSGHLEGLREVTNEPDRAKLILVDEIASGTDPTEGSALAAALLEEAIARGWWTVVTTHMGQLKTFAHRTPGVRNGSMQFDRKHLTPNYRFVPDIPGSSYALEIAQRVGLPKPVIDRARQLLGKEQMRLEDLIEELTDRLNSVHNRERELERLRSQVAGLEKRLEERLGDLESRRAEKLEQAAGEAEKLLADANRAIEYAVKEIRESQASREAILQARELVEKARQRTERAHRESLTARKRHPRVKGELPQQHGKAAQRNELPEEITGSVGVGDAVRLESGMTGDVLAIQGEKAQVAVGSVKVWLPLSELTRIRPAQAASGSVNLRLTVDEDAAPMKTELMLIGMRAEQAEVALEKYLEDLALAGLGWARIVHGKGTGALRAMVVEVLDRHPLVRNHRVGEPQEGGDGVTIVELSE
ncbi:MAG: endonuclease MutS2 [bacterium]